MKFIGFLICYTLALTQVIIMCPNYTCPTSSESPISSLLRTLQTNNLCLTYASTGVFNGYQCPSKTYCATTQTSNDYYCSPASAAWGLSYPGEVCIYSINCIFGAACTNGICVGQAVGTTCLVDPQCDVDLFCNPVTGKCAALAAYNVTCNIAIPCQSHLYCDYTAQRCLIKGTLANYQATPTRWACQTLYAFSPNGGTKTCYDQPLLANQSNTTVTTNCTMGYKCNYTISGNGGSYAPQRDCQCAYSSDGTAFCPAAHGAFSQNISILVNFTQNVLPHCHISSPITCFSRSNLNQTNFNTSWITMANLYNAPLYQNNLLCVQKGINQVYFAMLNGNYQPPMPTPNNSVSTYTALTVMAGLVLLI